MDERTLRTWVRQGAPVLQRGRQGKASARFEAQALDAWVDARAQGEDGLAAALVEKLDAQSGRAHRRLAALIIDHVPLGVAVDTSTADALAVSLLSDPHELVDGLGDDARAVAIDLETRLRARLTDLAQQLKTFAAQAPASWRAAPAGVHASDSVPVAREQLVRLQTEDLRVREAVATGALVAVRAVERRIFAQCRTLRDNVLNVPARISADMAATTSQARRIELVVRELRLALITRATTIGISEPVAPKRQVPAAGKRKGKRK